MEILSEEEILERVDEYTLYSFYLGFEPVIGSKYSSPLREGDLRHSFGVFVKKYGLPTPHDFLWKDSGMKSPNHGDIFYFVQRLYGLETRFEALCKVCADQFGGEFAVDKVLSKIPKFKEPSNIRIKSRPFKAVELAYWRQYNITPEILEKYHVTAVLYYYIYDSQEEPWYPTQSMYAYRIFGKYQLYSPKPKFFTNNWTDACFPGLEQLQGTDLLIITKAMKDIMCLRSFGYDATAPKAENCIPDTLFLEYCMKRYKRVVTLFDNDGKTSEHLYPFEHLQIPLSSDTKDPTDYCARYGPDKTRSLLNTLLWPQ
jgi:hypothetical protein